MNYYHNLLIRGILAVFIPFSWLLYILTPITIYSVYVILYLLNYNPVISFDSILMADKTLVFAPACIAVGAYYLLLLLILFTKDIKLIDRIKCFLLGSLLILVINLIRILILSILVINYNKVWFDLIHMTFWYLVSGIYVALVWIFLVYLLKIKSIPVYSDLKYLYEKSIFIRKNHNKKR